MALTLTLVVALGLLTAYSTDPVAEDFENFLNLQMVTVNEKYEALKAEVATWSTIEEDSQMAASIRDTLLPLVNESMDLLSKMELNNAISLLDRYNQALESLAAATGYEVQY